MNLLKNCNCTNKNVMVRVDYNVTLADDNVKSIQRIEASIDTIKFLINSGAKKIILISHLGDPKTQDSKYSLFPIVDILKKILNTEVEFNTDLSLSSAKITLLENLRFYPGEKQNDLNFAKELAKLADIYINDAFSCSHRMHASIVLLPQLLPSFMGIALENEIKMLDLNSIFSNKPVVAIIGGSKISTKLPMIKNLSTKIKTIIVCGALANTILKNKGYDIKKSLCENLELDFQYTNVVLPQDVITSKSPENKDFHVCDIRWIPKDEMILDIGPATLINIKKIIDDAKTVLWNGPLGMFEHPPFDYGSLSIGRYISNLTKNKRLSSILGGGDTLDIISKIDSPNFTYVSNAGGAFLKWLEDGSLVGIDALFDSWKINIV